MPQGKGTYGSQVGRPPKKKGSLLNDDREQYPEGGEMEDQMEGLAISVEPITVEKEIEE